MTTAGLRGGFKLKLPWLCRGEGEMRLECAGAEVEIEKGGRGRIVLVKTGLSRLGRDKILARTSLC